MAKKKSLIKNNCPNCGTPHDGDYEEILEFGVSTMKVSFDCTECQSTYEIDYLITPVAIELIDEGQITMSYSEYKKLLNNQK